MLIKAWAWAKAQSKIRVNEVHGEEEIYIVANESFDVTSTEVEEATQSGNITVQACPCYACNTCTCISLQCAQKDPFHAYMHAHAYSGR